jgi:TATA-binding protein-associated factor Taf7
MLGNNGLEKRVKGGCKTDGDDSESDGNSDSACNNETDEDSSGGEDSAAEGEMWTIQEHMKEMANALHELAASIEHNVQFADPRAATLYTRKTKMALKFFRKIQKKDRLVQSHMAPALPTFTREHAELLFIRTRPQRIKPNAL